MRRLARVSVLAALAVIGRPSAGTAASGPPVPMVAQAPVPAASPEVPRVMVFTWTLYPKMWAEIDLRLGAGAEALADVAVEGGEVNWNLHVHPVEASPATFVTLAQGVAVRATVRCAPDTDGRYSYLFGNDGNASPIRLRIELRLTGDARLEAVKP